jgi:hypothetical protein
MLRITRRSAVAAATVLSAAGASLLAGGGAAHAAPANGYFLSLANAESCQGGLLFDRVASGRNLAQGVISTDRSTPSYIDCVGALYRSSNGGRTWAEVSSTHSVWGNNDYAIASWTNWYSDGAAYLAKVCVHFVDGHTGRSSATACTSAR